MMGEDRALIAFAALSREHRLQIIRLLVGAGPEGMAAAALGEKLGAALADMALDKTTRLPVDFLQARRFAKEATGL